MDNKELANTILEKDLGILIDPTLTFNEHIASQVKKANTIVGLIRRSFVFLDGPMLTKLFIAMVRPHLEYSTPVWKPHGKGIMGEIEDVQRRATKLIPKLESTEYEDRLRVLKMPCLAYRRLRGDIIEVYKQLTGKYDQRVGNILQRQQPGGMATRGNKLRIRSRRPRLDYWKYSFSHRTVKIWNSLPDEVTNATTIKTFERRLDKVWEGQNLKYCWERVYNYKHQDVLPRLQY